ncbi:predicted protein [Plenodomus lingam JN3]|uniref:Predicted protein n=1 Tax=Leptosphaeria maculans (strain JN3 / isolate v23.1.3 / race Av1-4-5-6-7-8) TaxID=985895 RepID=E5ADN4_LEPMJ|nr:predicted protein [Plenodomus lingam JN3]CBY01323.1 predicted protein [Plenodomus lingam JN3]
MSDAVSALVNSTRDWAPGLPILFTEDQSMRMARLCLGSGVAPLPLPPSGPPGLATGAKAASQDGFRDGREHLKCALEVLFLAGAQHAQRPSFIHTTPQPEAPIDGPQCRRRVHGYRTGCSVLLGVALRYCGESLQLSGQDGSFSSGR